MAHRDNHTLQSHVMPSQVVTQSHTQVLRQNRTHTTTPRTRQPHESCTAAVIHTHAKSLSYCPSHLATLVQHSISVPTCSERTTSHTPAVSHTRQATQSRTLAVRLEALTPPTGRGAGAPGFGARWTEFKTCPLNAISSSLPSLPAPAGWRAGSGFPQPSLAHSGHPCLGTGAPPLLDCVPWEGTARAVVVIAGSPAPRSTGLHDGEVRKECTLDE